MCRGGCGSHSAPMRWITDDLVRKTYFQKRWVGLIKKVKELSILCDAPGMCVIYSPNKEPSPSQPRQQSESPTVWPSRESAVQLMLRYLREVIMKIEEKQSRELKKIYDMTLAILMDERWPLRWIADDLVPKTYFQKRGAGLIKKVRELSALCGVPGMCVIYSPYEEPSPFQPRQPPEPPTVWPSRESVLQLMQRYIREVIMKVEEKQRRELNKIQDMELVILMVEVRYKEGIEGLAMEQWRSLAWFFQAKIQDVQRRMWFSFSPYEDPSPSHSAPMRWITDDLVRKAYFQKWWVGLIKKVKELSILCDAPGMCVIYSPNKEPSPSQPRQQSESSTVWPSRFEPDCWGDADDPLHIDENEGSSSLLDRSENSDDEYEGVNIKLKL
ncbi:MADS-box transcription factor PHERES 1 [Linum grandiflorum]